MPKKSYSFMKSIIYNESLYKKYTRLSGHTVHMYINIYLQVNIMQHVQEVLSNFHGILTIYEWTKHLGQFV